MSISTSSFAKASKPHASRPKVLSSSLLLLGTILRFLTWYLLHTVSPSLYTSLSSRLELTNSLQSYNGLRESLSHIRRTSEDGGALSPYSGLSSSHSVPIIIYIADHLIGEDTSAEKNWHLLVAYTVCDLLTAYFLYKTCRLSFTFPSAYIPRIMQEETKQRFVNSLPILIAAGFLLNPFTLLSCVLLNTSCISQLLCVAVLYFSLSGRGSLLASMPLLALYSFLDMYPFLLLVPTVLIVHRTRCSNEGQGKENVYGQYNTEKYIKNDECVFVDPEENAFAASSKSPSTSALSSSNFITPDDLLSTSQLLASYPFQPRRVLKIAYTPIVIPYVNDSVVDAKEGGREVTQEEVEMEKREERLTNELNNEIKKNESKVRWSKFLIFQCVVVFSLFLALLLIHSYTLYSSSFSFLTSSYGYILLVPDLSPNYSLYWYFFTSIFDRFHIFFLVLFHCHVLCYLIPLVLRFYEFPLFLFTFLYHMTNLFKPYSTPHEVIFSALLLVGMNMNVMVGTVRRIYLILYLHLVSYITLGLMQYLWLDLGSGNANFFWFQSLLYIFTGLFMAMECLGAVRRLQAQVMEGRVEEVRKRKEMKMNEVRKKEEGYETKSSSTQPTPESKEEVEAREVVQDTEEASQRSARKRYAANTSS